MMSFSVDDDGIVAAYVKLGNRRIGKQGVFQTAVMSGFFTEEGKPLARINLNRATLWPVVDIVGRGSYKSSPFWLARPRRP